MRCLVTGASGHLGAAVVAALLARDHQVAVLLRSATSSWRLQGLMQRVRVIPGDLAEIGRAAPDITDYRADTVFHLGWHGVSRRLRNDQDQIHINVPSSLLLARIVLAAGCSTWIGVGSQAEYGPCALAIDESTPCRPVTTYGLAKWTTGLLTGELCRLSGARAVWLRLLSIYGPREDPTRLVPTVIGALLRGERPALTAGTQRCDMLYVDDAARAIIAVAEQRHCQGIYVLASGEAHSVRNIAETIRDLIDPRLELGLGELEAAADQPMLLQGDIRRIVSASDWRPQTPLSMGLQLTIDWQRKHITR